MDPYDKRRFGIWASIGLVLFFGFGFVLFSKQDAVNYQNYQKTAIVESTLSFQATASAPTWTPTNTYTPTASLTPTITFTPTITPTAQPCGVEMADVPVDEYQFPSLVRFEKNRAYSSTGSVVTYYKLRDEPWWRSDNGWLYLNDINPSGCERLPDVDLGSLYEQEGYALVFEDTFNRQGTEWNYGDLAVSPKWLPSPHGSDYIELFIKEDKQEQLLQRNQVISFPHWMTSISFDSVPVFSGYVGIRAQSFADKNTYLDLKFYPGVTSCKYEATLSIDGSQTTRTAEFPPDVCKKGMVGQGNRQSNFLQAFFDYDEQKSLLGVSGSYNGKTTSAFEFYEDKGYFSKSYFGWISSGYRLYIDYIVVEGK